MTKKNCSIQILYQNYGFLFQKYFVLLSKIFIIIYPMKNPKKKNHIQDFCLSYSCYCKIQKYISKTMIFF